MATTDPADVNAMTTNAIATRSDGLNPLPQPPAMQMLIKAAKMSAGMLSKPTIPEANAIRC